MKQSTWIARFSWFLEWLMFGLLTIVSGLELWQAPILAIAHLGLALLLCPKTPIHWTYKLILAILALASTFL